MKRIEAIVKPAMIDGIVAAIQKVGVGGLSVYPARGQGAADPPIAGQFFSQEAIVTLVDDSKVDKVIDAITNVACTGHRGDGIVYITNVEKAIRVCSKKEEGF